MSSQRPEELIEELARDLEPVRPIPSLRLVVGAVLALWLVVAAAGLAILGLRPDLLEVTLHERGVTAVFLLLGAAGTLGLVAALSMGVPGRERLASLSLWAALAAMALSAGTGTLLFLRSPMAEMPAPVSSDLSCLAVACAVGLLPALGVVWFAGRAAPFRPLVIAVAAAAGAAALGAVTAHASCPYGDMRHLMVGHLLAPAVGALLLTLPLLVALKRTVRA